MPINIIEIIMTKNMITAPTALKLVTKLLDDELPVAVGSAKMKIH